VLSTDMARLHADQPQGAMGRNGDWRYLDPVTNTTPKARCPTTFNLRGRVREVEIDRFLSEEERIAPICDLLRALKRYSVRKRSLRLGPTRAEIHLTGVFRLQPPAEPCPYHGSRWLHGLCYGGIYGGFRLSTVECGAGFFE